MNTTRLPDSTMHRMRGTTRWIVGYRHSPQPHKITHFWPVGPHSRSRQRRGARTLSGPSSPLGQSGSPSSGVPGSNPVLGTLCARDAPARLPAPRPAPCGKRAEWSRARYAKRFEFDHPHRQNPESSQLWKKPLAPSAPGFNALFLYGGRRENYTTFWEPHFEQVEKVPNVRMCKVNGSRLGRGVPSSTTWQD